MKKLIILFIFTFIALVPSISHADIPPSAGSHVPSLCAKVVNLNSFPDIVLIGFITGPMIDKEAYQIKNNECFEKGYKFNSFNIYSTTKDKFNSIDLKNLNITEESVNHGSWVGNEKYPTDLIPLLKDVEVLNFGSLVKDSNSLIKGTVEYSISRSSDGKLSLYISKQTSEYNDGTKPKIEIFSNTLDSKTDKVENKEIVKTSDISNKTTEEVSDKPVTEPTPSSEPIKRGFWKSIGCFLKGIFGRGC
ncbi:MAG: hypothetical protein WAV23_01815 [Minisyncoccia bacterium]